MDRNSTIRGPRWVRLSQGMIIRAVIEARLLGRKLLTLNANVEILPAEPETRRPQLPERNGNGRVGLAEAARSLEAGAADLEAARRELR